MYAGYFGLPDGAFGPAPDPKFFYSARGHRATMDETLEGVRSGKGLIVLTGEAGTGKTVVAQLLAVELSRTHRVAHLPLPLREKGHELLVGICESLGLKGLPDPTSETPFRLMQSLLARLRETQGPMVLVLDDAEQLSDEALDTVRLLGHVRTSSGQPIQTILVGRSDLCDRLVLPRWAALRQKVGVLARLTPLNAEETRAYIALRLAGAGEPAPVRLTGAALDRVWAHARGLPRRINELCEHALLTSLAQGMADVRRAMIDDAARQLQWPEPSPAQLGVTPLLRRLEFEGVRRWLFRASGAGMTALGALLLGFAAGGAFDTWRLPDPAPVLARSDAGSKPASPGAGGAGTKPTRGADASLWAGPAPAFAEGDPSPLLIPAPIVRSLLEQHGLSVTSISANPSGSLGLGDLSRLPEVESAGLGIVQLPFSAQLKTMIGSPCIAAGAVTSAGTREYALVLPEAGAAAAARPAVAAGVSGANQPEWMVFLWRDAYGGRVLRKGMIGVGVAKFQRDLAALGFYTGQPTGYFGATTEQALLRFLEARGLGGVSVPNVAVQMVMARALEEGGAGGEG